MTRIVKKPEERRREIINASKELFLEKDYENTTLQDVMKKLNIAKGTTYHYFRSKAELLDAVVKEMAEEYFNAVKEVFKACQGSALEKLKFLIASSKTEGSLETLHRPGNIVLHTRLLAAVIELLAPLYAEVIEQGCREGVFHVDHPLESAEFILASIQFLTDPGCYPWNEEAIQRRIQTLPSLIEAQLQAKKGSLHFITLK